MRRLILFVLIAGLCTGCMTSVDLEVPDWVSDTKQACDPIAVVVVDRTGGQGPVHSTAFYVRSELRKLGHDAVLPEEIGVPVDADLEKGLKDAGVTCVFTVDILAYGQQEIEVLTPIDSPLSSSRHMGMPDSAAGPSSRRGTYQRTRTEYKKTAFLGELRSLKDGRVFFKGMAVNKPLLVGGFAIYKLYNRRLKLQEMARDALDELVAEVPLRAAEKKD
jgi:hypothetical protein